MREGEEFCQNQECVGGLQSMAFCVRFRKINGETFLVFEFDGRSRTSPKVRWSKIDFFLFKTKMKFYQPKILGF